MKEKENLCKQVLHNLYKKTNGFKGSMKCAQEIFSDEFFFFLMVSVELMNGQLNKHGLLQKISIEKALNDRQAVDT